MGLSTSVGWDAEPVSLGDDVADENRRAPISDVRPPD